MPRLRYEKKVKDCYDMELNHENGNDLNYFRGLFAGCFLLKTISYRIMCYKIMKDNKIF